MDKLKEKIAYLLSRSLPFNAGTLYLVADDLIAHNVTIDEWTPASEPPSDFRKVLVSVEGRDETLLGRYNSDDDDWLVEVNLSEYRMMPVTYWKEMPKQQKGK